MNDLYVQLQALAARLKAINAESKDADTVAVILSAVYQLPYHMQVAILRELRQALEFDGKHEDVQNER